MARKPESDFIGRVHKHLPSEVYRMKLSAMFNNGIPDCYYEGRYRSLWVEYKYLDKLPVRGDTKVDLKLSALQLQWIGRCNENGSTCLVILGHKSDGWIFYGVGRKGWVPKIVAQQLGTDNRVIERLSVQEIAWQIKRLIH